MSLLEALIKQSVYGHTDIYAFGSIGLLKNLELISGIWFSFTV